MKLQSSAFPSSLVFEWLEGHLRWSLNMDFKPWLENILVLKLSRHWEESESWLQNTFEYKFLGAETIF